MINNEIAEFEFKSTGNKSHDSNDVGTYHQRPLEAGWKPTGDERPCFFLGTLFP
jgi:hypothetical protein